jgi:hypothetical protein
MKFLLNYSLQIVFVLVIALILNPETVALKFVCGFLFSFLIFINVFMIKRISKNSEKIIGDFKESKNKNKVEKSKLIKNLEKANHIFVLLSLTVAFLYNSGFFLVFGALIVFTEIFKLWQMKTLIDKS